VSKPAVFFLLLGNVTVEDTFEYGTLGAVWVRRVPDV
jgi:hypothetical protein